MDAVMHHINDLDKYLSEIESLNRAEAFLLQKHEHLKKSYIVLGVIFLLFFFVLVDVGAEWITNFVGFLFPAYASIRAIQTRNSKDDTQWLTYWVVFSVLVVIEDFIEAFFDGIFFPWFVTKYIFCIWLMYPGFRGAEWCFNHIILAIPFLRLDERKEGSIASKIEKVVKEHDSDSEHSD
uniref:Receptor expression-enhancing protein n=2 Tax=Paramoeba aestuarina TaxID=180227 RepID=A0A7S4P725_9EUKA|mmetsp:Transcript_37236/g.58629  ORF Transcript_37236/g.58629 Transcript_37236/m.58629 type:complete len:180 (+) Transcript_37236:37-576(+)|eukprot:CAMPEP_0201506942 /NCGR_PEP_ID=MMETSP0161_2-20130828/768_1 /ASSEMBLY_ACC=CAM_ASM_000251 /TAXON_ID=180227 /ORGANISM="Neoparamoeba aestuarina, Strain SoJaBio B1-5/56/2" /LENGTH=179 /DNA_ID=CAMNT_0047901187 /DNA_START=42 /DNA_END=581 /DNA_ORIENTATION=+